jgi:hypothetical protein
MTSHRIAIFNVGLESCHFILPALKKITVSRDTYLYLNSAICNLKSAIGHAIFLSEMLLIATFKGSVQRKLRWV